MSWSNRELKDVNFSCKITETMENDIKQLVEHHNFKNKSQLLRYLLKTEIDKIKE